MVSKFQESLNELYSMYRSKVHKSLNRFEVIKYDKCFDTLQELIGKETPKKPEKIQMIGITNFGLCPECNNSVSEDVGHQYSYCQRCGQKIGWWENGR